MTAADMARVDVSLPRPTVRLYTTVDHRVWNLNAAYVDGFERHWHWDGHDFDQVAGPEMVADDNELLHLPLIGLALRCGLHSDTTDAVAHGELLLQLHDAIEAGLPAHTNTGGTA